MKRKVTCTFGEIEIGTLFEYEGAVYRKTRRSEALLLRDPEGNVRPELINVWPFFEVTPLDR
ncbi:MAG: hypothetical protein AAGG48_18275 [Planctomycetota bacterium]